MMNPNAILVVIALVVACIIGLAIATNDNSDSMSADEFDAVCIARGGIPTASACLKGGVIILVR
jgi:hypothetical protein